MAVFKFSLEGGTFPGGCCVICRPWDLLQLCRLLKSKQTLWIAAVVRLHASFFQLSQ